MGTHHYKVHVGENRNPVVEDERKSYLLKSSGCEDERKRYLLKSSGCEDERKSYLLKSSG